MNKLFAVLVAALSTACIVDASHGASGSGGGGNPAPPPAVQPMVVDIDPDKTMNATGGDGVGVFVEYKSGTANGTWHVWWTCDTARTHQSCAFTVRASLATGALSNVQGDGLLSTDSASLGADGSVTATANTTTNVVGVYFDAPAAARITVDAALQGVPKTGDYLFFVQNGQVNGGYQGTLTNPLIFQPKQ